jgi:hypothetical protein
VAGSWIWFRNNLWREDFAEGITLSFVSFLVFILVDARLLAWKVWSWRSGRLCTQFLLKQSCEQKKLSLSIFLQVGHCSELASLSQSTPRHFRLGGTSVSPIFAIFESKVFRD